MNLLGTPALRDACAESLFAARDRRGFRLHAWVLMPNHAHLIVSAGTSGMTIADILRAIKQPVAMRVTRRWRTTNAPILEHIVDASGVTRFWQRGGGYDKTIRNPDEITDIATYVHQNPVRAELAAHATDRTWSSARWWDGERDGTFAVDPIE